MCGIFGAYNVPGAGVAAFMGLHALQHRGQESVGIGTLDGTPHLERGIGILSGGAIAQDRLEYLRGVHSIGQVRYPTQGGMSALEAQPFLRQNQSTGEVFLLATNGQLNGPGGWQSSSSDSERLVEAYKQARGSLEEKIFDMLGAVQNQGSYALCMLIRDPERGDVLVAAKDPNGNRPLYMGKTKQGGYVVASESCALQAVDLTVASIENKRELAPGEVIVVTNQGITSYIDELPEALSPRTPLPCFFEAVYFARPDSDVFGSEISVQTIRQNLGRALAREAPVDADIVVPVPDSARNFAEGYARELGIPYENAITRSHYIGRTFIEPEMMGEVGGYSDRRMFALARKFGFVEESIKGKKIVLVDDSIVRGNTMRTLIKALYRFGAQEIHLRIGSPPTRFSCFYGIDTADQGSLIANGRDFEQIRLALGNGEVPAPTSIAYLSLENTLANIPYAIGGACDACVTGNYEIPRGEIS